MRDPIFIVGLPRSGSTLWFKIICCHDEVMGFNEMLFLNPWRKDFRTFLRREVGDLRKEENINRLVEGLFSSEKIPGLVKGFSFWKRLTALGSDELRVRLQRGIKRSDRTLGDIFRTIVEEATRCGGLQRSS